VLRRNVGLERLRRERAKKTLDLFDLLFPGEESVGGEDAPSVGIAQTRKRVFDSAEHQRVLYRASSDHDPRAIRLADQLESLLRTRDVPVPYDGNIQEIHGERDIGPTRRARVSFFSRARMESYEVRATGLSG
jgi:hypothetical protein